MRVNFHIGILDKDVNIITNSLLLQKFIEKGFVKTNLKNIVKTKLNLSFLLEDPQDVSEALSSVLKIENHILEDMQDKYLFFHAAAFSQDGQATMVLGDAGSGKSSICFAAGLCGAKIISDEPVLIDRRSSLAIFFRYLIKVEGFCDNFLNWQSISKFNYNHNRFIIKKRNLDFNIFAKEDLNKLGIEVEDRKIPLKNIIFLEEKKYDSVIHLFNHCLNKEQDLGNCLRFLNNLVQGKKIKFLPDITHILKDEKKTKRILNKIIYT